jgi:hypothetical protein
LFDPARERAIERERARQRQGQLNEREELESHWPESRRSDRESRRTTDAESDRTALGGADSSDSSGSGPGFASASDATRRGVGLTLLTGLLCALGYYGVLGVQASGVQAFGSVVPPPFYALTFSILFVFSLVPRAHRGLRALGWSIVFSVVFGALLAVGTEGAFYLADNPDVATAGYTGLTVLALAIVVASVAYWGVLSVAKTA